jgi:hypothetical protein
VTPGISDSPWGADRSLPAAHGKADVVAIWLAQDKSMDVRLPPAATEPKLAMVLPFPGRTPHNCNALITDSDRRFLLRAAQLFAALAVPDPTSLDLFRLHTAIDLRRPRLQRLLHDISTSASQSRMDLGDAETETASDLLKTLGSNRPSEAVEQIRSAQLLADRLMMLAAALDEP